MSSAIIAGVDTETTGLTVGDHRIIEVYIGLWRDGKLIKELDQRIDPQRSISVEAQRIHGISIQDLAGKPTWNIVAPKVRKWLSVANGIVWHNGDFDRTFITHELERIGLTMPSVPDFCTMENGIWATPDGKKPSLQELCFACDVDYDPTAAHAASYDVREALMPAFFKGVSWGFFKPSWLSENP